MRTFVLGAHRATTSGSSGRASISLSDKASKAWAVMMAEDEWLSGRILTSRAIAAAVWG